MSQDYYFNEKNTKYVGMTNITYILQTTASNALLR